MQSIESVLNEYSKLNSSEIEKKVAEILVEGKSKNRTNEVYAKILSCIDLTSLNTEDTEESIAEFTQKVNAFGEDFPELPNVAAICVYPSLVSTVKEILTEGVEIASVAAGFPHSQTFIEVKIAETAMAIMEGATEIDVVISINKLLDKKYEELIDELQEIKSACREAHLKVILESGTLSAEDLRIACIISMEAGADFIKTSTGKQQPATTAAAFLMCTMIREFNEKRGTKVGFKAAGGISTVEDALDYYTIVEATLGNEWLGKDTLRFGASKLANAILTEMANNPITYF
jgi:deoxyribose-phosphate aldolase